MIGCLIGEVFALEAPTVLLNVNGVGYEIDTPLSTFCQLQKVPESYAMDAFGRP